ncbi:hypothetical protein [Massilia genomosp. 1]|uniref:Uncharacterized protein n=1 Tax=Massilia genomosp. 1 TaxID=2609280 RepID=A0ABX0MLM2_9BURK|nr:hypothetical protein [Massilia genomosp. 1]NHZ63251.1 hypothetical protein [Massilia genomosp. 1]
MYVEWPTALELARTPAQLFALVVIRAIVESDAVTPQLAAFATAIGIGNLDQIDAVSLDTGDDAPLACCSGPATTMYSGSFPLLC